MEMYYRGALIRPVITQLEGIFSSSGVIRDQSGKQEIYEDLRRFASSNAATLIAVNWAIANIEGKAAPKPPFEDVVIGLEALSSSPKGSRPPK